METDLKEFVLNVVLSETYNTNTGGHVDSPPGYYGYMSFAEDETEIDGIEVPEEFRGMVVVAAIDTFGNSYYDSVKSDTYGQKWFEGKEEHYNEWIG